MGEIMVKHFAGLLYLKAFTRARMDFKNCLGVILQERGRQCNQNKRTQWSSENADVDLKHLSLQTLSKYVKN